MNWNQELWLIDHGASLYFHHNWDNWKSNLNGTFPLIKDHVLLDRATKLTEASAEIKKLISPAKIEDIIANIPDDWLHDESTDLRPEEMRAAYIEFISRKISNIDLLVKEASDAR